MIIRLIRITFLLSLAVVLLGGWTRINYAGLGCPDWSGCYGELVVPYGAEAISAAKASYPDQPIGAYKAWLERLHRYVAGLLGMSVLAIAVLYRREQYSRRNARATALPALGSGDCAGTVWYEAVAVPLPLAMAHHIGAVVVLLSFL